MVWDSHERHLRYNGEGRVKMADQEDAEFVSPRNQGAYQAPMGNHGHLGDGRNPQ